MRKLVTNGTDDFRIKGYAGTTSVLLAMDLAESRKKDFVGFAIEKSVDGGKWEWLLNSLTFHGVPHTLPHNKTPSDKAPIQKFRWGDYVINPAKKYRFKVHLVYGTGLTQEEMLEIELKPDDGKPKGHHVNFNRAVAASQAFSQNFSEFNKQLSKNKHLTIEEWPSDAKNWLENGLLDAILNFIDQAADSNWALDVAIYEYELSSIVEAIQAAYQKGVHLRVLYHAKEGDEQTEANESHLAGLPSTCKCGRVTKKIFHDKFIVLSKVDGSGKHSPEAVLCGSTNFTENGVYRQANVVHVVENKETAATYESVFEMLWANHNDPGIARTWINEHNPIDESMELFAGFSPRSHKTDLNEFIKIIQSADQDLLFATAFALPDSILDALLGKDNDPVLRYGIQNTASRITGYHADRTAEFTAPALIPSGLEGWVKEGLHGQRGNLLIHTKAIVTNFTSDSPTILSGSHNLSVPASNGNDENYLIMRGNTDLADRYGLEILRFYEHYRFRHSVTNRGDPTWTPELTSDESWAKKYYIKGSLRETDRLRFAGR